jgi:colanic acid biosynthesis protein WcaH
MSDAEIKELIEKLTRHISDARVGLPQEVFYFVTRLTPMVNVDLLIKNEREQTLLVWRQDEFYRGWHIAGGIIRFKETIADRLQAVAKSELGARIEFDPAPLSMLEKFAADRDTRGHFLSLLYRCRLLSAPDEKLRCADPANPQPKQWMWHDGCPDNLLRQHEVYRKHMGAAS